MIEDVDRIQNAIRLAKYWHRNQKRKYNFEPYIIHLAEVASLVSLVTNDSRVIAAAWLHDCLEDQPEQASAHEIAEVCGQVTAQWVVLLTDEPLSTGNRAKRKAMDNERLANSPAEVQNIKICNSISNAIDIKENDPDFWRVFRHEKQNLIGGLSKADPRLLAIVSELYV